MAGRGEGTRTQDVHVLGGGVVGLAVAWRLAERLCPQQRVIVHGADLPATSDVAAGMLAPVTEAHFGEESLLRLTLAAAQQFATDVADLRRHGDPGHRRTGTLAVAMDADDRAQLAELAKYHASLGLDSRLVSSREMRELEPLLSPGTRGGLVVDGDHSVDNRRLRDTLRAAVRGSGGELRRGAARTAVADGRVVGVRCDGPGGEQVQPGRVVLAAGHETPELAADVPGAPPVPVRPVRGATLRLRGAPGLLHRTVRAVVRGTPVYLVPREDGEIVLGASMEEADHTWTRAGEVYELLRDAIDLLPRVAELELAETSVGMRPATPDGAPVIGALADGVWVSAGHFRNGVLLCLLTGRLLAAEIAGDGPQGLLEPFRPGRFR